MAGWGGAFGLVGGTAARGVAKGPGILITYALPESAPTPEQVEALVSRPGSLADGERAYHKWCARCHGAGAVSSSALPDLRYSLPSLREHFEKVVLDGLPGTGMPAMRAYLAPGEVGLISQYLASRPR